MSDEGKSRDQLLDELEALRHRVAGLEQAEEQSGQTASILKSRIKTIDCLNEVGQRISENPSLADLMKWVADRIPLSMRYPEICLAAVELEGRIYGAARALSIPWQMVQGLRIASDLVGRVYVSYVKQHDFVDGESALLGDVARRLSLFIEQKRLAETLTTERNRLKRIVERLPMGLVVAESLSGRPLLVNDLAKRMLGQGIGDSVAFSSGPGRYDLFYQGTDKPYVADEMPLVRGLLGETVCVNDIEVRRHDGARMLLEAYGAPVRDESGRIVASVSTWQDVTQQRQTEAELERRAHLMETVADVVGVVSGILEPELLVQELVNQVHERFLLSYAALFLTAQEDQRSAETGQIAVLRAASGQVSGDSAAPDRAVRIDESSPVGWCIVRQQPWINDLASQEVTPLEHSGTRAVLSELALPLVSRGEAIGALVMQSQRKSAFGPVDVSTFGALADLAANAVLNSQSYASAQSSLQRVQSLYGVSRALSLTLDENEVMRTLLQAISRDLACKYAVAYILDEETRVLEGRHGIWQGEVDVYPEWTRAQSYSLEQEGVLADVFRAERTEVVSQWDPRFDRELWSAYGHDLLLRAYAPIKAHEHVIGVVEVGYDRAERPRLSALDTQLLDTFVAQAAVALENALLFRRMQHTLENADTLNAISAAVGRSLQLDEVLEQTLARILAVTQYDVGLVSLVDPDTDRLYVAVQHGLPEGLDILGRDGMEGTLCESVFLNGELLALDRLNEDAPVDVAALVAVGLRSYVGVSLESRGQRLGTLCLFGREPVQLGAAQRDLMQAVGRQVGAAVDHAALFAETQRALAQVEALYETNQRLVRCADLSEMVAAVADGLSLPTINRAVLWMVERREGQGIVGYVSVADWHSGHGTRPFPTGVRFTIEQFPAAGLVNSNEALCIPDLDADSRIDPVTRTIFAQQNAKALVLLPLRVADRQLGLLMLIGEQQYHPSAGEMRSCTSLAGQLAVAVDNQRLLDAARTRARREQLIREISDQMQHAVDLESLMEITADQLSDALNVSRVYVQMETSLLAGEDAASKDDGLSSGDGGELVHDEG